MPEIKYKSYSSEFVFGKRSDQESVKEGLGRSLGNRASDVKKYQKSENKWKRGLKVLKKKKNMFFTMANSPGSRRELKKMNNIRAKASKKYNYSSSDSSSSDSDSHISSDIE